jgi:hypothetical protein
LNNNINDYYLRAIDKEEYFYGDKLVINFVYFNKKIKETNNIELKIFNIYTESEIRRLYRKFLFKSFN